MVLTVFNVVVTYYAPTMLVYVTHIPYIIPFPTYS